MICKCPDKRKDGKSSFKDLCEYIAGIGTEEKILFTENKNFDDYPDDLTLDEIISIFNTTADERDVNAGDPVFHAILSWCEGEIPTKEQVDEAVEVYLKEQGLQGHQCFYALHNNTDILHAHICVSRVNPNTLKTIRAGDGKGFWKKANERAARKIELAQGWKRASGKFYEVLEDKKIVEVKTHKVIFEKSLSTKAKDYENLTGAKSGERIAREKLAPILFNATSWQELHKQLAENGARLQKKGAGLVLVVGEVPVKLSSVSQQLSLKKLEKRLGNYETPKEDVSPPEKIDKEPLIKEMPSIDDYLKKRKEYYETKKKAFNDLKENYKREWQELREKQKKERQADFKSRSSWKGHGAELNWMRTRRAVLQLEEKELFKKKKKKQREAIQKMFNSPFMSYKEWLINNGKSKAVDIWRYRETLSGFVFGANDEDSELYPHSILYKYSVRQEKWEGKLASVFRNKADKVCFVDRGKKISIERFDDKENLACALKLAQQKWGSVKINGTDSYKNACIEVAIRHNIRITNPELQERIARRKAEVEKERQRLIKEQRYMGDNARKIRDEFERYDKAIGADTYRITVAKRIQEGEAKGGIDQKKTWLIRNATKDKELTAREVKERCGFIDKLLASKNEIYITPISHKYHYILVDDVKKETLPQIPKNGYDPAIGIESSPNNFQLIMKVPKLDGTNEETEKKIANKLMRELNQKFGDPKICSAVHPHRMPGTYNFKPKYCDENNQHPQIKLGYDENVVCKKCEERLQELSGVQKEEHIAETEKRKAELKKFEKGVYSIYDDKLTPYDAYMCHARDIYQFYSGRIKDERGNINMSVIDSMVAVRMVITGYSENEIARGIAEGSRDFRPESEKDKHNWKEYGARTAHYPFTIAGEKEVNALRAKEHVFKRYVEGRKPLKEKKEEALKQAEKRKQKERMERQFGKSR